jgi:hypothetical protein
VVTNVVVLSHVVAASSDPYAIAVAVSDVIDKDEVAAAGKSVESLVVGVAVAKDSCLLRSPKLRRMTPSLL